MRKTPVRKRRSRAYIRRKIPYSKERLAFDMSRYLRTITEKRAIEVILTLAAHLRTGLLIYNRVELPGLGLLDITTVRRIPHIRFIADPQLERDLQAAWRDLEL